MDDSVADGEVPYELRFRAVLTRYESDGNLVDELIDPQQLPAPIECLNQDDDLPGLAFASAHDEQMTCATSETGQHCLFYVKLLSQPLAAVQVPVVVSDDTEARVMSLSPLQFGPGGWYTPMLVQVVGKDDYESDGDIEYHVTVGPTNSTDPMYNGLLLTKVGINKDNDISQLQIKYAPDPSNPSATELLIPGKLFTTEAGGRASFTMSLSQPPTHPVSMDLSSTNVAEGVVEQSQLRFDETNYAAPQTISMMGVDDGLVDGDAQFGVAVRTSSGDAFFDAIDWLYMVKNYDDEVLTLSSKHCAVNETGSACTVTVSVSGWGADDPAVAAPFRRVAVSLQNGRSDEAHVSPSALVFDSAEAGVAQTVTVTGVDDFVDDGDQAFNITFLGTLTYTGAGGTERTKSITAQRLHVVNRDDDSAGLDVTLVWGELLLNGTDAHAHAHSAVQVTDEAGSKNASFAVALTSEPTAVVTIPIGSRNMAEGFTDKQRLIFTPANWQLQQVVVMKGVDDNVADGDIMYEAFVGPSDTLDPLYAPLRASLWFLNQDEDERGFLLTAVKVRGTPTKLEHALTTH
jgi:hypothetical protein